MTQYEIFKHVWKYIEIPHIITDTQIHENLKFLNIIVAIHVTQSESTKPFFMYMKEYSR